VTKVRFDVTDSDPEEAVKVRSFDSPKPGMYKMVVTECESTGSGGDPDKPMLKVVLEIEEADKKSNAQFEGGTMWYYPLLPGHPSYDGFPMQKTDQFLLAAGIATKRRRKGQFDTDDIVGVEVVAQVRAGKSQDGTEYRGEIANVLAFDEDEWEARKDDSSTSDDDDEAYDEPDMPDDEDEEEEVEEDDEEVTDYTTWSVSELKAELEERELDIPKGKAKMVAALEDDDEGDEAEEEDEEVEEEDAEEESDYTSMSISELKSELKKRRLNIRGTKPSLIERLEANDAGEDEDEEEEEEEEEEAPAPRKSKSAAKKKATAKKPTARKRGGGRSKSSDGFPFEP
jgi:hypothetical protein